MIPKATGAFNALVSQNTRAASRKRAASTASEASPSPLTIQSSPEPTEHAQSQQQAANGHPASSQWSNDLPVGEIPPSSQPRPPRSPSPILQVPSTVGMIPATMQDQGNTDTATQGNDNPAPDGVGVMV